MRNKFRRIQILKTPILPICERCETRHLLRRQLRAQFRTNIIQLQTFPCHNFIIKKLPRERDKLTTRGNANPAGTGNKIFEIL